MATSFIKIALLAWIMYTFLTRYFDWHKGIFLLKNGKFRQNYYGFDSTFHVWVLKGVKGPAVNKLTPKEYFYSEEDNVVSWNQYGLCDMGMKN
jgi:hypothetical protein